MAISPDFNVDKSGKAPSAPQDADIEPEMMLTYDHSCDIHSCNVHILCGPSVIMLHFLKEHGMVLSPHCQVLMAPHIQAQHCKPVLPAK